MTLSSDRRDQARRARRLPVRFWQSTDPERVRQGYTTNISDGGMFIGTNQLLQRGSRVRVEILDPRNGFVVEGEVARVVKSAPLLKSVQPDGMGIRFLPVEELVAGLFPRAAPEATTEVAGEKRRGFAVHFRTLDDLRTTYERDVAAGGLFVASSDPARVDEVVLLEVRSPTSEAHCRLLAKVVHRFEPSPGNLISGMGVEFSDPELARTEIHKLLAG